MAVATTENDLKDVNQGSSNPQAVIKVLNPQDGSKVGEVPSMDIAQVQQVIDQAVAKVDLARDLAVHQRMAALNYVATALQDQHEDFAQLIAREGIKTLREARKEVTRCVDTFRHSRGQCRRRL